MNEIASVPIDTLLHTHPYAKEFFLSLGLKDVAGHLTAKELVSELTDEFVEDCGLDRAQMLQHFTVFIRKMSDLKTAPQKQVHSLSIIGGRNKSGEKEDIALTFKPGDIVCVVGPTGSGKSRLLADIECLAQKDTPTGRQILINGSVPDNEKRFSIEHKLVAQLSQNMNFVVDLTVAEFMAMHAESRMIREAEETVRRIIACANELAGEPFDMATPVTQLSGGQSRALMIADTAFLSPLPVVVIDEIENAGIDRGKALDLLVQEEKIVIMSTHDPILALMGGRRVVIGNGGIKAVIETNDQEQESLKELQRIDARMVALRNRIRSGGMIDFDIKGYFCD
ncbi:MAG: Macrolide export ATP-binding/permease protein MacB [Syntrophorhabdus sp. PtaU1.Bin002]|nr:MAG: Macrolide export ATP-binding/permease protein MacB [Syntrophorhabdus sp. PtaB.Bin006]OPY71321.1 MAG: Macrolide export ATP-binding/permease protein MacB [Syntrophorhabdus sp. PtaU1.Bin002]